MRESADLHLEPDDDTKEVPAALERIRTRGERVCTEEYQEGVTRLEAHLGRPLDHAERAAVAELAGRLGSALLAGPLQSLSRADDCEAVTARRLFTEE